MRHLDRRAMLGALAGGATATLLPWPASAGTPAEFVMFRDPGCGCCLVWAKRVEAAFGKTLRMVDSPDMAAVKRMHGVPEDLRSCHTALIGGIVAEGHVPPEDIRKAIARRSSDLKGLAVPGMPAGSPGMDVGHDQRDAYEVIAFSRGGKRVIFARHG